MKCRNIALLTLAPLLLLPLGATSGSTDPIDSDVSPDGVALWDLTRSSTVWGRTFTFDPPEGVHEKDVFSLCEFDGPGSHAATWECLRPYIADVQWLVPGAPGSSLVATGTHDPEEVLDVLPELPGVIDVTPTSTAFAFMDTSDFTIHDNIDGCCSKAAEGYVVFEWYSPTGWSQSTQMFCSTQSASSGFCGVWQYTEFQVTTVGPNNCTGIRGKVQFWDNDVSSSDRMDISSRTGDAVADIDACTGANGQWWSEHSNFDSSSSHRCHGISVGTFCALNGNDDATGDNDDESLEFSIYG